MDRANGEAIGYLEVPNTGSENKYKEVTVEIKKTQGIHNWFFVFNGKEFQFYSWKFEKSK